MVLGFFVRTLLEIGGTAPGPPHDRLSVADTLDLAGDPEVQLINESHQNAEIFSRQVGIRRSIKGPR